MSNTEDKTGEVRFYPHRDDPVAQWLKQYRDLHLPHTQDNPRWMALDDLLDDYRLHADTGKWLGEQDGWEE